MQSATGFIVGRFTEVGEVAPEVACRSVFGFLALMIVVSLALYLPVRDIETGWHGRDGLPDRVGAAPYALSGLWVAERPGTLLRQRLAPTVSVPARAGWWAGLKPAYHR